MSNSNRAKAITDSGTEREEASDRPFAFGRNWKEFLSEIDEGRIRSAEESLASLVGTSELSDRRFLDAGSGSGLFSLAARRLGARVVSLDADPESVECARQLKARFSPNDDAWLVLRGSLLDVDFLASLERFEYVYCWGVAHHTGAMWTAIDNLVSLIHPGGTLVLAIYNDQGYVSRAWRGVKQIYQRLPRVLRPAYILLIGCGLFARRLSVTLSASLLRLFTGRNPLVPFIRWMAETQPRGMHGWYDLVDWVGGWPFEVAKPEEVFRYLRDRGFVLRELTTSGGPGCNEFVFIRTSP